MATIEACEHADPHQTDTLYEYHGMWLCIDCLADAAEAIDHELTQTRMQRLTLEKERTCLVTLAGHTQHGTSYLDQRIVERRREKVGAA